MSTTTWRPLVVDTIADVLGREPGEVDAATSLFDLPGFDSIAVVTVLERLEDTGGIEVPPENILPEAFESPETVCALLDTAPSGARPSDSPSDSPGGPQ